MLILAVASIIATDPPRAEVQPAAPSRQAVAVVQIVRPASLRFQEIERSHPELLRDSLVRAQGDALQPARLVEFQ